jgi:hypothetical protein
MAEVGTTRSRLQDANRSAEPIRVRGHPPKRGYIRHISTGRPTGWQLNSDGLLGRQRPLA